MLHFSRWTIYLILGVCLAGVIFAAPNLMSGKGAAELPSWVPSQRISLGLDLQGGSHLLLEVDLDAVVRERLTSVIDDVRLILRRARLRRGGLSASGDSVSFRLLDPAESDKAVGLLAELGEDFTITSGPGGRIKATLKEQAIIDMRRRALEQSIEIVRRRIDETGTKEPTIARQGENRILLQLPGIDDPDRVKRLLGKTAKLAFHLVDLNTSVSDARRGRIPPGSMLLDADDEIDANGNPVQYVVRKRVRVGGENLVDARPTTSQQSGQAVVSFRFDGKGGRLFGETTSKNVGKLLAIVLDGKVISAPRINEPILGGSGIITGSFTLQSAGDLALLLRAGALPAPLKIVEERTVGPELGADSIAAGKLASILGLILVVVFMAAYYGLFGLIADVALIFNMILLLAALSLLQATLTLPGIAGIVLTIGMAVDANVLIFERVREEVRAGRSPISALDAGYRRALTTIIDSNLTTFIAAFLLLMFGSGPIRGFAVTLCIGIATSMFTALMLTRLILAQWLRHRRPTALPI